MEDGEIIELFYARSEQAIIELSVKYGATCQKVANHILNNISDAEECVNDAYLGAWNTIPPQRPNPLLTYLNRIVRNLAVARYHSNTAIKRNSYYDVALDELEDCLASTASVEDALAAKELLTALNRFLGTLEQKKRVMFVRRYWYADSIPDIARRFHISNNYASVCLMRIRKKLKQYLKEGGYLL